MIEYSNTRAHETRTRVNFTQSTNFRVYTYIFIVSASSQIAST